MSIEPKYQISFRDDAWELRYRDQKYNTIFILKIQVNLGNADRVNEYKWFTEDVDSGEKLRCFSEADWNTLVELIRSNDEHHEESIQTLLQCVVVDKGNSYTPIFEAMERRWEQLTKLVTPHNTF